MKRRLFLSGLATLAAATWLGMAVPAQAEGDFVYGRELMTPQETAEHRTRMRSLNTEQEREAYRQEHHRKMQERAREQGKVLPDEPGPRGRGQRPGGMGPRSGAGRGINQA